MPVWNELSGNLRTPIISAIKNLETPLTVDSVLLVFLDNFSFFDSAARECLGVEVSEDNVNGGLAESAWGPVEMTGGTVNVSGKVGPDILNDNSTGNYLFGSEINISGGTLNVQENSGLKVVKGFKTVENDDALVEKGTINLTNAGVINLSGGLWSDINGNGSLNFKTAGGLVDGDVSGSKLSFDTDHSLSKAISGIIGNLAALNVNKGTFNYDKTTGKITDLKIKDSAGLDIEQIL